MRTAAYNDDVARQDKNTHVFQRAYSLFYGKM